MKREFKLFSVLLIQLISVLVVFLITRILSPSSFNLEEAARSGYNIGSVISAILGAIIQAGAGFIIARGLITDRNGSVGEYLNKINDFSLKSLCLIILMQLLISVVVMTIGAILATALLGGFFLNPNSISPIPIIIFVLIMLILAWIGSVFYYHSYFVAADYGKELSFGRLFSKAFDSARFNLGNSLKVIFKYLIAPLLAFILILTLIFVSGSDSPDLASRILIAGPIVIVLSIIFACYFIYAGAKIYGEISNVYLDSKQDSDSSTVIYE